MTDEQIIEMAKQAHVGSKTWVDIYSDQITVGEVRDFLKAFAKLVEDKVTARYMQLFLDPENQPTQFGTATQEYRQQEIKDEREACAKAFEAEADTWIAWPQAGAAKRKGSEAIRARGEA